MKTVAVARIDQIPDEGALVVNVGEEEVALFKCSGELHAVDNVCPHRGGPLAEGEFNDGIVSCPWHAWTFDVRSGLCTINPAARVRKFKVEVQGERVLLHLDGEGVGEEANPDDQGLD